MRGSIVSTGFTSGDRFVVGHWREGPLGPMTDLMWASPEGWRTLLAPSAAVADFITSVYAFDEVVIGPIEVTEDSRTLHLVTDRVHLWLHAGRAVRIPVRRPAWFTRFVEGPIARATMGVRTYGTSPTGIREWYRTDAYRRLAAATGSVDGTDLGAMAPVDPPARFGFSEPPRRPSWVEVRPLLEGDLALPA
jgi:hypothetical protein